MSSLSHAFTLVELIICLAIVGVIAAIAIPEFVKEKTPPKKEATVAVDVDFPNNVRATVCVLPTGERVLLVQSKYDSGGLSVCVLPPINKNVEK